MNVYNTEENNNSKVTPYKAMGNLNKSIANPSMQVNNAMNVNIQSVNTIPTPINDGISSNNNSSQSPYMNLNTDNINASAPNMSFQDLNVSVYPNNNVNNLETNNKIDEMVENQPVQTQVNKKYVSNNNAAPKKKITINLGSEFKIALLIIVILLAFVFVLPIINSFISG